MNRLSRYIALFVIAFSLQAGIAFAAPASWKSVDVTLRPEQQQSVLFVSGELPPTAKLPAQAELAVPAGMQLSWIGEILGGDPSKDPELKYTKSSAKGMDVYRFTLTKARVAQVEGAILNPTSFDGTNYVSALTWTAWRAIPEVRISQRIPQGSRIVQAAPSASMQPGSGGYSYYTKTIKSPEAGDVLDLSFSYSAPAAGSTSGNPAGGSSMDTLVRTVILTIVIAGFVLLIVKVRSKSARPSKTGSASKKATGPAQVSAKAKSGTAKTKPSIEPAVEVTPKKVHLAIPTLIVIGIFVAGAAIAGSFGTSAAVADGKISRNFGAPSACQSRTIPFTVNQGVDLARQGEKLLKGLEGMEGVGVVTVDLAQSTVDVAWCESSQSEASMRQALTSSGLITLGQPTASDASGKAATAKLNKGGKKQTATVDTASGSFSPGQVTLKAGVPAEISFGTAAGCLSEVVISDLGITQDLTKGPATVKLPALKAGTYTFACAMGHQSGQLVVQ